MKALLVNYIEMCRPYTECVLKTNMRNLYQLVTTVSPFGCKGALSLHCFFTPEI